MSVDQLVIAKATTADILSLHDIENMPALKRTVYKTYGKGFMALDFLRSVQGRSEMVSSQTMSIWEEHFTHRTIEVGDTVTLPGNTTATFNLSADDVDSLGNYYPRVNFKVLLGNTFIGFTTAVITAITTGPVLAIKTLSGATITAGMLATGMTLAIGDSMWAPETGMPQATSVGKLKRDFYAQILKEKIQFGGMELARQKWHEFEGLGLFNAELTRGEFLLDLQEEMMLIMGEANANSITQVSSVTGSATAVSSAKGIYPQIDLLGGDLNYAQATSISIDDLDDVAEYLESVGITDNVIWCGLGGGAYRRLENAAVDYVQGAAGGLAGFARADGFTPDGSPDGAINIGFKMIKKGGNLFILHKLPIFTNPTLLGAPDYKLNDAGIMLPLSMVRDAQSGLVIPNLSMNYVGLGGYSRKRQVFHLGGTDGFMQQMKLSSCPVTEIDANATCWMSHVMPVLVEAYKGVILKATS